MKYKRYERYKDSGVEWIGEIPEEWEVCGFTRYISSIIDYRGKTPEKVDEGVFLVTAKNIKNGCIDYSLSQEYVKSESYKQIMRRGLPKIGDVIFTTEAPLGEVANIDRTNIALAQRVIKFRGKEMKLDNYYLKYWIMSHAFQYDLHSYETGSTATGIKSSKLSKLIILLPTFEEQKSIANFLDQKTAEIDDLIADKEKLIELLQEKRQAIITEAVTKGLNPNVRMKDSGVEWIGEIPEHWEIVPLKHITNFISRGNSPEYVEESSIKVINQACIYWDELKIENVKYQYDDINFEKLKGKLIKGDLLLNSTGTGTLGRAVVFRQDGKYMADSHVTIVRFNKTRMNEVLAFYLLQTKIYQGYINNALVTGATNQIELSRERLTGTPMIVPPSTEQKEIVNFLNSKIGQIANLIKEIKKQTQKLKEYRQSLISEAVTGKIDVREFADKGEVL